MANYYDDRDYRGPDLTGHGRDYDRSRDWPGSLDNTRDYGGLGNRRGYYGGWDYDDNFGGRDYGLDFDRGYGGGGYPHRGDTGRDFDRGYGARGYGTRDDAQEGRRYELTFEHGYGAWDAVRDRELQRGDQRRAGRSSERGMPRDRYGDSRNWGSADPYRPGQDRTQEWLLHDYPWGRAQGRPQGPAARRRQAGPHTGRGPKGYQRPGERIEEDANERLTRHGGLDARHIRVRADRSEITLEGSVHSRREKRMAEDALETIPGVRDIHNRLRIERSA